MKIHWFVYCYFRNLLRTVFSCVLGTVLFFLRTVAPMRHKNASCATRSIRRRRFCAIGLLILAVVGMMGACDAGPMLPPDLTLPGTPTQTSEECADTLEIPCMRYRIELLGNPTGTIELQKIYKEKLGPPCYVAAKDNSFNCYYKTPQDACKAVMLVPDVVNAAAYEDHPKTCLQVKGTENWSLQTGSDPSNVSYIYYEDAPRQTPLVMVDGTLVEVNGPYRNLVEKTTIEPGKNFYDDSGMVDADGGSLRQRDWVLAVNRKNNEGKIRSDLAGFTWPCVGGDGGMTTCKEPDFLADPDSGEKPFHPGLIARVHHAVPMKDKRCCPWGTNSYRNAAVISHELNEYFTNNDPPAAEVKMLNDAGAYTP